MDMKLQKPTLTGILKMGVILLTTIGSLLGSYYMLIEPKIQLAVKEEIAKIQSKDTAEDGVKLSDKLAILMNVENAEVADELYQAYFWYKNRKGMDSTMLEFVTFWNEWEYVGVLRNKVTKKYRYFPGEGYLNHYRVYQYDVSWAWYPEGNNDSLQWVYP